MGVALVADVKNKLILGGIENVVECYSCLDKTKVRTYVSAMFAHTRLSMAWRVSDATVLRDSISKFFKSAGDLIFSNNINSKY